MNECLKKQSLNKNINYIKKVAIECIENNRIESDFLEYKKSADKKRQNIKNNVCFCKQYYESRIESYFTWH